MNTIVYENNKIKLLSVFVFHCMDFYSKVVVRIILHSMDFCKH